MNILNPVAGFLSDRYANGIDLAKRFVSSKTWDCWEYDYLPYIFWPIGTALAAAPFACAISYLKYPWMPLWKHPLAQMIALFTPLMGYRIAKKARSIFYEHFKSAHAARQIDKIADQSREGRAKSVLIFQTTNDPSGSFAIESSIDKVRKWAKNHSIDVIRGHSEAKILQDMGLKIGKNKNYDSIVFSIHSFPKELELAKGVWIKTDTPKFSEFMGQIKALLKSGGSIVIEGCDAGLGKNNAAQAMSCEVPEATVYASSDISGPFKMEYDHDMKPRFYSTSTYSGAHHKPEDETTKIYRNGMLIARPV